MATHLRPLRRMAPAAAAFALSLGFITVTPALAADDGQENFFSAVAGMLGVNFGGDKDAAGSIDYHERAPLVLPPKMELRQPLPTVAKRAPAWPQDPELVKAKKAALAKAPRVNSDSDHDSAMSTADMRRPGTPDPNAKSPAGDCLENHTCTPAEFWATLKNTKKQETVQVDLVPGQEPPREYLTQPPPGYLAPTKVVKATGETPRPAGDDDPNDNSAAYFRHLKESQSSPN